MSELLLRPMTADDLSAVLQVQAQCYPPELIESADALASRLALAPSLCWVAAPGAGSRTRSRVVAYLFTHPWPRDALPPWNGKLRLDWDEAPLPASAGLTWFVHDMAVAPEGQGRGLARRLFARASEAARATGLRCSRLIAVRGAARWWEGMGYARLAPGREAATRLSRYGSDAVVLGRDLA